MYNAKKRMKTMNKKFYIAPIARSVVYDDELLQTGSIFDESADSQSIVVSEEEANEFTSRRGFGLWDEE